MMKQEFEYKIVTDDAWKVQTIINTLGAQGWEAVSVSATPTAIVCLLKRPKSASNDS